MKLHKAHSSVMAFPILTKGTKIYNKHNNNNNFKKDIFLTIKTDDINFVNGINNTIEKKINALRMNKLGILEKSGNNDKYKINWTSNKNIFKNIRTSLYSETNKLSINTVDQENYKNIFRKQTENIFNTYLTAKNYKIRSQLKTKFLKLNINTDKLLFNSKQLCFNNYINDLLINERNNINKNEEEYSNALKKENKILNKDIKKFDMYKVNQNLNYQKSELNVQKYIKDNAILYESVKMNIHEYHSNLNRIQQSIKTILKLRDNVIFIYELFGLDDKMINLENLDKYKIILNASNQFEVEQNINNIISQSNILFNKFFEELTEELSLDTDKIYLAINNKENTILKLLEEKEDIRRTRYENELKFKRDIENSRNEYDIYMKEYLSILQDYEAELEKYNLNIKNSKLLNNSNNIELISEIKKFLFKEKNKEQKINKEKYIYSDLIIPCLEKLKQKEFFLNNIINKMEYYKEKDPLLFNKCLTECKLQNKIIKLEKEKNHIIERNIQEKLKILEKNSKIIIRDKYRYNSNSLKPKKIKISFSDYRIRKK